MMMMRLAVGKTVNTFSAISVARAKLNPRVPVFMS
jgi:hypothetical protein